MAEEIVTKFQCDRCGHTDEVELTSGLFGVIFKKPAPPGWGCDKNRQLMLCATCYTEYHQTYEVWFNAWLRGKELKC